MEEVIVDIQENKQEVIGDIQDNEGNNGIWSSVKSFFTPALKFFGKSSDSSSTVKFKSQSSIDDSIADPITFKSSTAKYPVYSDHLPVWLCGKYYSSPVILSWNVSEAGIKGLAPRDLESYPETTEEKNQRYDRIVAALENIIKNNKNTIDFIALQGIKVNGELYNKIKRAFETEDSELHDYDFALPNELSTGVSCITLFSKNQYELDKDPVDVTSLSAYPKTPIAGYSCKFKRMDDDSKVVIHNVCYTSEQPTESLKTNIKEAFKIGGTDSENFIVGDFGRNIMQDDRRSFPIITSVYSERWGKENEYEIKGNLYNFDELKTETQDRFKKDYQPITYMSSQIKEKDKLPIRSYRSTDGGFFCQSLIKDVSISSCARNIMDPKTGAQYLRLPITCLFDEKDQVRDKRFYPAFSFEDLKELTEIVKDLQGDTKILVKGNEQFTLEMGLNPEGKKGFILTMPQYIFKKLIICKKHTTLPLEFTSVKINGKGCIQIGGEYEDMKSYFQEIRGYILEIEALVLKHLSESKNRAVRDNTFISSFVVLGVISAATIISLESFGVTALTTNLWMFQDSAFEFVVAQDILLVAGAIITLALISSVTGIAAQKLDSKFMKQYQCPHSLIMNSYKKKILNLEEGAVDTELLSTTAKKDILVVQ